MTDIGNYLNIQQAYAPSFAPDGSGVAFLSNLSGLPQLYYTRVDSENVLWSDQLTFGDDRVVGVRFSPTQDLLIYSRDSGGNENAQLFLLELASRQETALTEGFEDAFHMFSGWHPDGKTFFFAANRRDKACFDLYKQRIGETEAELIFKHGEFGYLWSTQVTPDGERVIAVRMVKIPLPKSEGMSRRRKLRVEGGSPCP